MMLHIKRFLLLLLLAALLITACQPLAVPAAGDAARQAFEFTATDVACADGNVVLTDSPFLAGSSEAGFTQEPDELYFAMMVTFFPEAYPEATWEVPGDGIDLPDGSFVVLHQGVGSGTLAGGEIFFVATPAEELDDLPCEPVGPVVKLEGYIIMPATSSQPDTGNAGREIAGRFGFPSPAAWGVDLWIDQDFNVREVNAETHAAEGTVNWGVYNFAEREWKLVEATAHFVLFDESGQSAVVIAEITEKSGWGEGEPGEYAFFWVHDGDAQDQFGIHYYSDFNPDVGFKEFFPAEELPSLGYAEPEFPIAVETGDVMIHTQD